MIELHDPIAFEGALLHDGLAGAVVQGLDLSAESDRLLQADVAGTVFLGCRLSPEVSAHITLRGGLVFPNLPSLPFNPYRGRLYGPAELFDTFDPSDPLSYCECLDARIYRHWERSGRAQPGSILETLARRLHDHAITDAVEELLESRRRVVAVMGGHSMARTDPSYSHLAIISRELTLRGYFMVSGGGPGAMEAAHLGAWFAPYRRDELDSALQVLSLAPSYRDFRWLAQAFLVLERFPAISQQQQSLGIPTWLYGHEPPNPFASHIAKYFANSIREDGLVTIATHGIIFAPGSAGTIQEIFQDATQNHYGTVGFRSPMVFFNEHYWSLEKPVFPLLRTLAQECSYGRMLTITDDPDEIVRFIETHPPEPCDQHIWSFCNAFAPRSTAGESR